MSLEMRDHCERCGGELEHQAAAFICSYECTFCPPCTREMGERCPNCSGELVARPRRMKRGDEPPPPPRQARLSAPSSPYTMSRSPRCRRTPRSACTRPSPQ